MDLQNLMIMKTLKGLKAFSLDKRQMNRLRVEASTVNIFSK